MIQEAARSLSKLGISVIPTDEDKKAGPWKEFETRIISEEEIPKKFNGSKQLAIVCGQVSGQLECVDIDDIDCHEDFINLVKIKHKNILDRILFTKTPNGFGIVYRCESEIGGNLKLAYTWDEVPAAGMYEWNGRGDYAAKEHDGKWIVSCCRIETRGEGGYFLTAPSKGYEILHGSYEQLQPISADDRLSILTLAKSFDLRPAEKRNDGLTSKKSKGNIKPRGIPWPGDIFSREANYEELLEKHGWKKICKTGAGITFARPGRGKKVGGILYPDGNFHVFSSNAAPLEEGKQYTAFAFLVHMEYAGDFKKGTQFVLDEGYSVELEEAELKEILKENPEALDDAFSRGGISEEKIIKVATELGIPLPPSKQAGRIEVFYDKLELNRVVKEVDYALTKVIGDWGYYSYSDQLGYVTEDNRFRGYDPDTLELRCEQSMYMIQFSAENSKKVKLERCRVHAHVIKKLLTFPDTSAPKIIGFAKHPVVSIENGGKVLGLTDGFESGIMFSRCTEMGFKVDDRSFQECYDRIIQLFCGDILFKDKEIGQSLFISMLMTGLCRLGIPGGCPGYFITANEPGTGKSTLFEFVSRIIYGELTPSVDWGTDQVERRKEIIANLREGQECFLFDNIPQGEEVASPILAQALTAGNFRARIMGKGEMTFIQAQSLFVFIGNNLNMSTELTRRLMTIELLAQQQDPA